MNRKQFLQTAGGALSAPAASLQITRSRPRNVVVLLSDQHHPRARSGLGDVHVSTPNLDGFAAGATSFQSAYCSNPVCGPSRASILTGLYTHHHGVFKNDVPWPSHPTFAHHFSRAGYQTALIGKAHFADGQNHGFSYKLDFNEWFQYLGPKTQLYADELPTPNGGSGFPQVFPLWEKGDPWRESRKPEARDYFYTGRPSPMAEPDHFDSWVARESIRFLRNFSGKQPFLLVASFLKPHNPYSPPPRFIDPDWKSRVRLPETYGKVDLQSVPRYIRDRITKADSVLKDPEKARLRTAMYNACVGHMDHCVGEVLRALTDSGLADDTVVVYTSDHGEMRGEHGLWDKFVFYESSAGVPLIFRVPGLTKAGAVCEAPVSQVGLAATLLDVCGLPAPAGLDEPSLAAYLREPAAKQNRPVYSEFTIGGPAEKYLVRQDEWKYAHYMGDTPELYNLREDPLEMRNLAQDSAHRDIRDRFEKQLLAWRAR